jgi:fumarate reductase subunit D
MRVNSIGARHYSVPRRPAYIAFLVHRLSGLCTGTVSSRALLALSQALRGESQLEGFLSMDDNPTVKVAEWGLVLLLAAHAGGGLRMLAFGISAVAGLAAVAIGHRGRIFGCGEFGLRLGVVVRPPDK